jgi:uncharacterized repeat protein (TIGR02543 family)
VAPTTYSVTYDGNTNGSGAAPTDSTAYLYGANVTVAGNTGTLAKTGYTFDGWCTTQPAAGAACTGTAHAVASTFSIVADTTLYAVWVLNTQTITYAAGGGSGSAPSSPTTVSYGGTFTTPANTYTRTGFTFAGWSDGSSTYAAGVTYPASGTVSGNVTLTATWAASCASGGTCAVGDTGPGGGIVFYVAGSNFTSTGSDCGTACRYLEAAPADVGTTHTWCSNTSTALGVTATGIGNGMANTTTADTTCTSGAIQQAADYTNNGKSDWHLPSKDELNQLYLQKTTVGGFAFSYYWSSSESSAKVAWAQLPDDGFQSNTLKTNVYRVRPIRAFGLPPFSVTYNGNTNGSGAVPTDSSTYAFNASVTVASNTGSLAKSGYTFGGWCTTQPAVGSACGGTSRAAGSTFSVTSNVTLYAVWTPSCASGGACVVGDTGPGGGIVFYVAGSNFTSTGSNCNTACRYLEVAPVASEVNRTFAAFANSADSSSVPTPGATATAIGSGMANTNAIQAQAGNTASTSAAVYAYEYSNGGAIDWHLPSRDELAQLYTHRVTVGGLVDKDYWSSSESDRERAIGHTFSVGYSSSSYRKNTEKTVRPIRAFG